MAFTVIRTARLPLFPTLTGRTHNDAAGFASCCGPSSCSPKRAFDTGLRPDPFPDRAASLLPGLLTATRTGLTPASDDEHEQQDHPATSRGHLLFHWAHRKSALTIRQFYLQITLTSSQLVTTFR